MSIAGKTGNLCQEDGLLLVAFVERHKAQSFRVEV